MIRPEVPSNSQPQEINVSLEVSIDADTDIVAARQQGRMLAVGLGFSSSNATAVATAISELARNIVLYATRGQIILNAVKHDDRCAVIITARDQGMGIADLSRAVQDGYSTSGRSGVGLPGVMRLMDEFDITSDVGKGTVVTVTKWQPDGSAARTSIRPGQFNKPEDSDPSLDRRGSDERERDSVEGTFARSQEARTLLPSSPQGRGGFDAKR